MINRKLKILVVEDDMIIQMFISKTIKMGGDEVIGEARNSSEVLHFVKNCKPDLILMDIGISGEIDGIETAKLLNKSYCIPLIFITGNSDESTIERAKKTNPVDILFKPIDESKLKDNLSKFKARSLHK